MRNKMIPSPHPWSVRKFPQAPPPSPGSMGCRLSGCPLCLTCTCQDTAESLDAEKWGSPAPSLKECVQCWGEEKPCGPHSLKDSPSLSPLAEQVASQSCLSWSF